MHKVRIVMAAVFAVLAMGAVTAVSASAHGFFKEGVLITAPEPVTSSGGLFRLVTSTKEIDCESVTDVGTVGPGAMDFASEIHFLNCTTNQAGCDVHSEGAPNGLILVTNTLTELTERSGVLADEFQHKANGEFVTLLFTALPGGSCSEFPETKVEGQIAGKVNNTTESLEFTNPELSGNSLKAFGKNAKLFGTDKQTLTNGGKLTAN